MNDLDQSIFNLEKELRQRDPYHTGVISRSEFTFVVVRNGGVLTQVDALAEKFATRPPSGGGFPLGYSATVDYRKFIAHMQALARGEAEADEYESAVVASPPAYLSAPPTRRDLSPELTKGAQYQLPSGVASAATVDDHKYASVSAAAAVGSPFSSSSYLDAFAVPSPWVAASAANEFLRQRSPPMEPTAASDDAFNAMESAARRVSDVAAPAHVPASEGSWEVPSRKEDKSSGHVSEETGAVLQPPKKSPEVNISLKEVFRRMQSECGSEVLGVAQIFEALRNRRVPGISLPQLEALCDGIKDEVGAESTTLSDSEFITLVARLPPATISAIRLRATWDNRAEQTALSSCTDQGSGGVPGEIAAGTATPVAVMSPAATSRQLQFNEQRCDALNEVVSACATPSTHKKSSYAGAHDRRKTILESARREEDDESIVVPDPAPQRTPHHHADPHHCSAPANSTRQLDQQPKVASRFQQPTLSSRNKGMPAGTNPSPAIIMSRRPMSSSSSVASAGSRTASAASSRRSSRTNSPSHQPTAMHNGTRIERVSIRSSSNSATMKPRVRSDPPQIPKSTTPHLPDSLVCDLGGKCSQLMALCSTIDRNKCGCIGLGPLVTVVRSLAPSLLSQEATERLLEPYRRPSGGNPDRFDYAQLVGDLIIAATPAKGQPLSSPYQPTQQHNEFRSPSLRAEQRESPMSSSPKPRQALVQRAMNSGADAYHQKSPPSGALSPQHLLHRQPPLHLIPVPEGFQRRSPSPSLERGESSGVSLEERVRIGREKIKRLLKHELLSAASYDVYALSKYFIMYDLTGRGYMEERSLRRALMEMFRDGGRSLPTWTMDRAVKIAKLPFELCSRRVADDADLSGMERAAAVAARRHLSTLVQRSGDDGWCDYKFLLADLGMAVY